MQTELDDKISTLRIEKLMLQKSMAKATDDKELLSIEKRIVEVNNAMKKIRYEYKEKIFKEKEGKNEKY